MRQFKHNLPNALFLGLVVCPLCCLHCGFRWRMTFNYNTPTVQGVIGCKKNNNAHISFAGSANWCSSARHAFYSLSSASQPVIDFSARCSPLATCTVCLCKLCASPTQDRQRFPTRRLSQVLNLLANFKGTHKTHKKLYEQIHTSTHAHQQTRTHAHTTHTQTPTLTLSLSPAFSLAPSLTHTHLHPHTYTHAHINIRLRKRTLTFTHSWNFKSTQTSLLCHSIC